MDINDKVIAGTFNFGNRVIMPPMATAKADEDGHVTDMIKDYYRDKTKNGLFGAVIVEHSYVLQSGIAHRDQISVSDDSDIKGLSELASVIKKSGSKAVLQISHAGGVAKREVTGEKPVAPSAILSPTGKSVEIPKELSQEEIEDIRDAFIHGAERAFKAGFDAVELHSAHGYLLDQFLSPLSNKREDLYGGNILNRVRLHIEIIKGIRDRLGDYPIFVRLGAGDFMDGGLKQEDAVEAALALEDAGANVIDVSGGMCFFMIEDTRPGYFDVISKPVFDAVNIPVILTGGVETGDDVIKILSKGVCDIVGVGRSVLRDSDWMERELGKLLV